MSSKDTMLYAATLPQSQVTESLRIESLGLSSKTKTDGRIQTYTGGFFDFIEPHRSTFEIMDVAVALSRICRFTGHTKRFYSVAQHSVYASYLVPPEHAFAALLHDSSEAFCNDISTPLKALLPDYKALEKRVEVETLSRFGLKLPMASCVKSADTIMLRTEQYYLMPNMAEKYPDFHDALLPLGIHFEPLGPDDACDMFMARYKTLTSNQGE